jgi:hypothetical protein
MNDYQFEREARTPNSEAYAIERGGEPIGRIDLHFTSAGLVHATLCVPQDFDDDDIQDVMAEADERLVLTTDPYRDDFVVTVWRGALVGVYSEDEEEDEDESGNGRTPVP